MEKQYGLIGEELSYSLSKEIHSIVNPNYEYYECKNEAELETLIKSKKLEGFNVTIPYKETVIKYLDELDETAEEIQSVNTVMLKNGKYVGFNTDHYGVYDSLLRLGANLKEDSFLVLGSGGSAKTVEYLLRKHGNSNCFVVSRTGKLNYKNVTEIADKIDCIINTTPVGMHERLHEDPLINIDDFKNVKYVFDMIYSPIRTKLLYRAIQKGLKTLNGLWMLIRQAHAAEELFLDNKIEISAFATLERRLIFRRSNIVFYGIAGGGKTTLGDLIAKKLNRKFYDVDELIMQEMQMNISDMFLSYGEDVFRVLEHDKVNLLAKMSGAVISVGGGAVLDVENVEALKLNGVFLQIKRDIEKIETIGRPLYSKVDPEKLYLQRKEAYDKIEDLAYINEGNWQESTTRCYEKILDYFGVCSTFGWLQ